MNENDLRRALAGHAAAIRPGGDPERLAVAMVRTDRLRATRNMGVGCLTAILVAFGALSLTGGESHTPLDVINQPAPSLPADSEVGLPTLDEATTETSTTLGLDTTLAAATSGTTPGHLVDHEPLPTSTSATAIVATTLPPTTSSPPPSTSAVPTTSAPTTTVAMQAFSASARYGSCAEDPPYDEYSGTAIPGATITVTSPYSNPASVTADPSGNWWIRVEFPNSVVGQHFDASISDGTSSQLLGFVRTA